MAVGSDGAGEISHTIKTRTSRLIVRGLTQDRLQEAGDIFYLSFLKEDAVTRIPTSPFSVPSRELAAEILGHLSASPHERTVAVFEATTDKLLAGGCIALHQDVHAIGPVFVDPDNQLKGIGRLVMQALLEISRAENAAASVRLTQSAPNQTSFALYASVGFAPVECLSAFYGAVDAESARAGADSVGIITKGVKTRLMEKADIGACSQLFIRAGLGYSREDEIRSSLLHGQAGKCWVALRDGTIEAYSTGLNIFGHTIASNEGACVQVMIAAGVAEGSPACFHLPVRLCPKLLQWALASKFRLARHVWYMVSGQYQPPADSFFWLPDVLH